MDGKLMREFKKSASSSPGYIAQVEKDLAAGYKAEDPMNMAAYDYLLTALTKEKEEMEANPTPPLIKENLDEYVIGQEEAKKTLSVAVFNHLTRIRSKHPENVQKSNVLMIGSTGTGKTLLAKTLAKIVHVPFVIADATSFSPTGFVGTNVDNIILRLFQTAKYDVEAAQKGIVYIDEIDKLRITGDPNKAAKDGQGEGVQQALLKLMEGTKIYINTKTSRTGQVVIDTTNILFICGGAFSDIVEEKPANHVGFIQPEETVSSAKASASKDATYGLIPEFMGRVPVTVRLSPLSQQDLRRILEEPKNSLVKQYETLFQERGITLSIDKDVLDVIAERAYESNTGARSLRTMMEDVMQDVIYNFPYWEDEAKTCHITKDTLETGEAEILRADGSQFELEEEAYSL